MAKICDITGLKGRRRGKCKEYVYNEKGEITGTTDIDLKNPWNPIQKQYNTGEVGYLSYGDKCNRFHYTLDYSTVEDYNGVTDLDGYKCSCCDDVWRMTIKQKNSCNNIHIPTIATLEEWFTKNNKYFAYENNKLNLFTANSCAYNVGKAQNGIFTKEGAEYIAKYKWAKFSSFVNVTYLTGSTKHYLVGGLGYGAGFLQSFPGNYYNKPQWWTIEYSAAEDNEYGKNGAIWKLYSDSSKTTLGYTVFMPFCGYKSGTDLIDDNVAAYWLSSCSSENRENSANNKMVVYKLTEADLPLEGGVHGGSSTTYLHNLIPKVELDRCCGVQHRYIDWDHKNDMHGQWDTSSRSIMQGVQTCNCGASTPGEAGEYLAYGEFYEKDDYSWENYLYCEGTNDTITHMTETISGDTSAKYIDNARLYSSWQDSQYMFNDDYKGYYDGTELKDTDYYYLWTDEIDTSNNNNAWALKWNDSGDFAVVSLPRCYGLHICPKNYWYIPTAVNISGYLYGTGSNTRYLCPEFGNDKSVNAGYYQFASHDTTTDFSWANYEWGIENNLTKFCLEDAYGIVDGLQWNGYLMQNIVTTTNQYVYFPSADLSDDQTKVKGIKYDVTTETWESTEWDREGTDTSDSYYLVFGYGTLIDIVSSSNVYQTLTKASSNALPTIEGNTKNDDGTYMRYNATDGLKTLTGWDEFFVPYSKYMDGTTVKTNNTAGFMTGWARSSNDAQWQQLFSLNANIENRYGYHHRAFCDYKYDSNFAEVYPNLWICKYNLGAEDLDHNTAANWQGDYYALYEVDTKTDYSRATYIWNTNTSGWSVSYPYGYMDINYNYGFEDMDEYDMSNSSLHLTRNSVDGVSAYEVCNGNSISNSLCCLIGQGVSSYEVLGGSTIANINLCDVDYVATVVDKDGNQHEGVGHIPVHVHRFFKKKD